jgi:hypothetical protein
MLFAPADYPSPLTRMCSFSTKARLSEMSNACGLRSQFPFRRIHMIGMVLIAMEEQS